jgi:hypothetical protein
VEELTFQKYGTYDNIPEDIIVNLKKSEMKLMNRRNIRLSDFIKKIQNHL